MIVGVSTLLSVALLLYYRSLLLSLNKLPQVIRMSISKEVTGEALDMDAI